MSGHSGVVLTTCPDTSESYHEHCSTYNMYMYVHTYIHMYVCIDKLT